MARFLTVHFYDDQGDSGLALNMSIEIQRLTLAFNAISSSTHQDPVGSIVLSRLNGLPNSSNTDSTSLLW